MTFTKVLCPTDFSAGAEHALRTAVHLARDVGAELVVAHVWYLPPSRYTGHEPPLPPDFIQDVVDGAQRALDAAVSSVMAAGVTSVSGRLLTGVPWVQIVEELERDRYDVCILGTQGRTGLARFLLGSVAEMVVRHAPCSVLAVRPGGARPFAHALVPTDFSASAAYALDLAVELIRPGGAISLLNVVEQPAAYRGELARMDIAGDLHACASTEIEREVDRTARVAKVPVTSSMRFGSAGAQILAALEEDRSIDLVIMGSHGRTGLERVWMGSVAEKVVRHATCSVLVARARAA